MHIQAFSPELKKKKKKEKEKGCTSEKEEEKNNLGVVHPILLTRIGKSEEKKKENFIVA